MTRCECPACGQMHATPAALWAHRNGGGCRGTRRPAWIDRASDPIATRHPRGWIRGGVQ